jgi:hypothetical protein
LNVVVLARMTSQGQTSLFAERGVAPRVWLSVLKRSFPYVQGGGTVSWMGSFKLISVIMAGTGNLLLRTSSMERGGLGCP